MHQNVIGKVKSWIENHTHVIEKDQISAKITKFMENCPMTIRRCYGRQ